MKSLVRLLYFFGILPVAVFTSSLALASLTGPQVVQVDQCVGPYKTSEEPGLFQIQTSLKEVELFEEKQCERKLASKRPLPPKWTHRFVWKPKSEALERHPVALSGKVYYVYEPQGTFFLRTPHEGHFQLQMTSWGRQPRSFQLDLLGVDEQVPVLRPVEPRDALAKGCHPYELVWPPSQKKKRSSPHKQRLRSHKPLTKKQGWFTDKECKRPLIEPQVLGQLQNKRLYGSKFQDSPAVELEVFPEVWLKLEVVFLLRSLSSLSLSITSPNRLVKNPKSIAFKTRQTKTA